VYALERTIALWAQPTLWRNMQRRAMAMDVSWTHPAAQYATLFRALVDRGTAAPTSTV